MNDSIIKLAIFFLVGIGMAAIPVILSFLLWRNESKTQNTKHRTQTSSKELEPYESGMPPEGSGRGVGFEYFIYAVLFLLFDVIAILAFLGVLALRQNRLSSLLSFGLLLGLSLLVIAYGVKKRNYLNI